MAVTDDEPGDPSDADDEDEADQPVEHDDGRDRCRHVDAAGDEAEDERAVDDAESAGMSLDSLLPDDVDRDRPRRHPFVADCHSFGTSTPVEATYSQGGRA
jgi:hypothetical protein